MTVLLIGAADKDIKTKKNFGGNHGHNILRLFDVLPNFPFTTIETNRRY